MSLMPKNGTACFTLGPSTSAGPLAEGCVETGHILPLAVRRGKWHAECERFGTRAVVSEVVEAVLRLSDGGNVSSRHPPQGQNRFVERLEPLFAIAKRSHVCAAVDELLQRLQRLPHRHVDRH